ncbi:MAG TPA: MASE1 domain-containing protein [Micromonosporaceae bacterium]
MTGVALRARLGERGATGLRMLAVAVAYSLGAQVGLLIAVVRDQVTPLWPPTGVALVALLAWGLRIWPGIAVGALVVNVPMGPSWSAVGLITLGNTVAPVAVYLLLRRTGFRSELNRLRDALALVLFGTFAAMTISATAGALALFSSGALPRDEIWSTWSVWWTGDAMGLLVVAPVLLVARSTRWPVFGGPYRWLEVVGLLAGTCVVTLLATHTPLPLLFLVFPFLIWAALRFQQLGATPCALIISIITILAAVDETGPFEGLDLLPRMTVLQAFNGTVALTGLLLAAITAERDQAHRAINRAVTQLADALAQQHPDQSLLSSALFRTVRQTDDPSTRREDPGT